MRTFGIGTTNRANLAQHIANLDEILPDDAVIYKQAFEDRYYVGYPGTNPTRLEQVYGGMWIYLTSLTVHDYEINEVQSDEN
jgi:hypothetical protein